MIRIIKAVILGVERSTSSNKVGLILRCKDQIKKGDIVFFSGRKK